jgi:hypothetical protein
MWVTPRAASCSTILLATVGVPAGVAAPSSGTNADLGAEQMGKTYPREGMEQCALLLLVVYVVAGGASPLGHENPCWEFSLGSL